LNELIQFLYSTGVVNIDWRNGVMLVVALGFIYLAISRGLEPYELLPIGLGIIIANLPLTGLTTFNAASEVFQDSGIFGIIFHYGLSFWNILPPIIFLGLGAMTDFGPIIANPKTLLLGAAAQIGIFAAFWGALATNLLPWLGVDFTLPQAAAIGIIGGADGPTTIFLSARLAPELLGITAVIAYSYMASVVFIQPPLMKLMTTRKERSIEMPPLREVSQKEKLIFPTIAMIIIILVVPRAAPLIAMFMIGNIFRESGVVPRLTNAASNELLNVATIFLMITVGTQLSADKVFTRETVVILVLGLGAFSIGTMGGLLFAKVMNFFLRQKINPLIGSAGVSAVPMAARISHLVGQEANSRSYLLPHAIGPNVAGVIGSAVVAGIFISLLPGA
jgi:oxaloacetate decarboxylase beta subunit